MKLQIFSSKASRLNNPLTFLGLFISVLIPIRKYRISGMSMYPVLKDGDVMLVLRCFFNKKFRIGDVVACRDPRDGRVIVKRVTEIRDNMYFVIGDNEDESTDSRVFGMIEERAIMGKMICKII